VGKCYRCHNEETRFLSNWLDYQTAFKDRWEIKRRLWDSWDGAYFKQPMPTGNSPEHEAMTQEERRTVRDWVDSGAVRGVLPASAGIKSKAESIDLGKRLFTVVCTPCHQPTGLGMPGRFPPLAGSDFLNSDKKRAIRVLLKGLQGEVIVNGQRFNNSMPCFPLSDEDIANALTYVYNSFGNSGKQVTPQEVKSLREQKEEVVARTAGGPSPPQEKSEWE
jgi:mono/diheme cytochrome c family protein